MAIRSGRSTFRYRTDTAGCPHTIANLNGAARTAAFYRVINSGEHAFLVKVLNKNDHVQSQAEVAPGDSADFALDVQDKMWVEWAAPATAKNIEGMYNFLGDANSDSLEKPRSGRVKGVAVNLVPIDTRDGIKFVQFAAQEKATAVYRVFNSSKTEPLMIYSGATLLGTVQPRFSLDVAPGIGEDLTVKGAEDKEIELIYDFLAGEVKR